MTLLRRGETTAEPEDPEILADMADSATTENNAPAAADTLETAVDDEVFATPVEGGSQTPEISVDPADDTQDSTLNGSRNRTVSTSSASSSMRRGGVRSTSSKFASLRAAFEQPVAVESADSMKRRLSNSDKSIDRVTDRKQEYEAEIAKLKNELERERDTRIAFEEKVTALEEELEEVQGQVDEREAQYEQHALQLKNEAESRINAMALEARSRSQDATNLQKQLVDLKRSVSTSTRTSPQTSDTTFRQEIGILQHEVQNWVVNNFRRVKLDTSGEELCTKIKKVTEERQYERLKPIYEAFEASVKLPIYQSTVACFMMEIFEEPFLFGLQGQRDWGQRLKQAAEGLSTVLDAATYNRWRASTFDALRQAEGIKEPVDSAAARLAEMVCITLKAVTDMEDSDSRRASLKTIVLRAISIAHSIRVQQSQYLFTLPSPGDQFDIDTMDDINEEENADRTIRCATFPAIFKLSDEDGDLLDEKNIVVKAKVLCNE